MLKKISKKDIILFFIIIGVIFILGFFYFLNKESGKKVRVSKDNKVIDEFNLNDDISKKYQFEDQENELIIKNGQADIISANCKNQICVNTNPVDEVGETIACLPHGLIIEVIEE